MRIINLNKMIKFDSLVLSCRELCLMKGAYMLVSHHCTRCAKFFASWNVSDKIKLTCSYLYWNNQVVRGKQAHYCYDDADLKKLKSSFPPKASYNIQRFKGMMKSYVGCTLVY